jgi:hypothetical protein
MIFKSTLIRIVFLLFALPLLSFAAPPVERGAKCKRACYLAKATAYENCRTRPATDREGRQQCFRRADEALASCLKACT